MSLFGIVLLVLAAALLVAAEWPRLSRRARRATRGPRRRRKAHLRVVEEPDLDPDEFARAVERDLANLPTYDPNERRR